MNISPLQSKVDPTRVQIESLAADKSLTEEQKIGEASRQFEAIMVRQFLAESQKPMIKSSFTDDSACAGVYQDMITNQLSDSITRNGGIGIAKSFQHQLTHHSNSLTSPTTTSKP